jgi:hypothetical protein
MPSGGTPTALPANGDQTLLTPSVPLNRKGRFDNVLLGQTITLALNVRLSSGLANVGIAPSFCTQAVLPGPDGRRGTEDDELVSGDIMTFQIPDAVRMALANPTLGIQDSTVRGLLELANRALAGVPTGGATWSWSGPRPSSPGTVGAGACSGGGAPAAQPCKGIAAVFNGSI